MRTRGLGAAEYMGHYTLRCTVWTWKRIVHARNMGVSSVTAWYIRELYFVFLEPWLVRLGLVKLGFGDATYGREAIPYSPSELDYIYDNPDVKVTRRRVFFSGNEPILDLKLQGHGLTLPFAHVGKPVTSWVNYYVWERPESIKKAQRTY